MDIFYKMCYNKSSRGVHINNGGEGILKSNKVNRVYEIKEGFHIDLGRVIGIRQFVDIESEGRGRKHRQHCWIEVYMDCDQIMVLDNLNFNDLYDTYNIILAAWESYANSIVSE